MIGEVELPLSDLNIIVGANGSGKSSIIQAVHLACCMIRQADKVKPTDTSTLDIEELDYLPSNDYKKLGHEVNWGNRGGGSSSSVTLSFEKDDDTMLDAWCTLRSARNAGISITGKVPSELTSSLRTKRRFFSAYIPGISGIPNKEERRSKRVILKSCSYGDSNFILRNVLLLIKKTMPKEMKTIEGWIERIIGPISISVEHDNETDLHVQCSLSINGSTKPIELAGTGYIQLIQIFCYIIIFKPGILLIDEPDIHLHPYIQERLVQVLSDIAKDRNIRVLLTTHSPFIIRGAPPSTNVYWLESGGLTSHTRPMVELALGWGAFGRKIIIISEDSDTSHLKLLLSQWREVNESVVILPGKGYKSLVRPKEAEALKDALGGMFKIVIHRDRDSLTDKEVEEIKKSYLNYGVSVWIPTDSDIEAYFCNYELVARISGITNDESENIIKDIITNRQKSIEDQFKKQREAHNREFHGEGGGPTNKEVWDLKKNGDLKGAKGKLIFNELRSKIPKNKFRIDNIEAAHMNGIVALDLKNLIMDLLDS